MKHLQLLATVLVIVCGTYATEYTKDGVKTICPLGSKCDGEKRTPCPPGTYQDQIGQSFCKSCPSGWHQSEEGSVYCIACPIGLFCNGTTMAINCPPGSYQMLRGQTSCRLCQPGEYQPDEASAQCDRCPAGHTCPLGSVKPIPCPAGKYQPDQGAAKCLDCVAGQYQMQNGSAEACQPCPAGHYCPLPNTPPEICQPHTYSTTGAVECQSCPVGHYQDELGKGSCKPCPKGSFCEAATMPARCHPGYYQPNEGQKECIACAAGSYATEIGSTECKPCPSGHQCKTTTAPVPCNAGYYSVTRECEKCPEGTYQPLAGKSPCIRCPRGHQCSQPAQPAAPCGPGTYNYFDGQTKCETCPIGHFCQNEANLVPKPCPPGSFQDKPGHSICNYCPTGSYQLSAAASVCSSCQNGYDCSSRTSAPVYTGEDSGANTTVAPPTACPLGQEFSLDQCRECGPGRYRSDYSQPKCLSCPPGMKCPILAQAPIPCFPGSYSPAPGETTHCLSCKEGTYTAISGQTSCGNCPAGNYCPTGTTTPIPCKPGSYSDDGAAACKPCGEGTAAPFHGTVHCSACPRGHKCPAGTARPVPCEEGFYQSEPKQAACVRCTTAHKCPLAGMRLPIACPTGQYQNNPGQKDCLDCPEGFYQKIGSTKDTCEKCPAGSMCKSKTDLPTPCPENHYQDVTGQASCKPCPKEQYQPAIGQIKCLTCPVGHACPFMAVNKTLLLFASQPDPEEVRNDAAMPILLGSQEASEVQDKSAKAPPPSVPIPCSAGSFSRAGQIDCSPSPKGHFTPMAGAGESTACPSGTYCPAPGNKKPYPCPNGYAVYCHAEEGCNKCGPGRGAGSHATKCAPDKPDKDPCEKGDNGDGWGCAKNQGKCVMDAGLNALTGGLWTAVDLGIDAVGAGAALSERISKDRAAQKKVESEYSNSQDWIRYAATGIAVKEHRDKLREWVRGTAGTTEPSAAVKKLASGYKVVKNTAKGIDCLADNICRGDISTGSVIKSGLDSINTVADGFGDIGPSKWRNFAKKFTGAGAKFLGRKIPLMCNLIEAFSKECRGLMKDAFNDCERRRKRATSNGKLTRLQEYTVFVSPVMNFAQKNPDIFIFLAASNDACRDILHEAWGNDTGDGTHLISAEERVQIVGNCSDVVVDGLVGPELFVDRYNEMQKAADAGFMDGTFAEDLIHGWAAASEAIPTAIVDAPLPEDAVLEEEFRQEILQEFAGAQVVPSILPKVDYALPDNTTSLYLLVPAISPNLTADSRVFLTNITMPTECKDITIYRPGDAFNFPQKMNLLEIPEEVGLPSGYYINDALAKPDSLSDRYYYLVFCFMDKK